MDVCGILGLWYCSIQSVFLSFSYAVIMEFNFKWYNGMNHIPSYFGLLGWSLPTLDSFHALPCIRWDFLFVWALMYNQMSDFNGCIITYYCKQYDLNKPMSVPFFFKLLFASTNSSPWFSGCWMLNNQFSFVLKIDYRSAASSYCWWCGTSVIHSLQLDCSTVFATMCYYWCDFITCNIFLSYPIAG